MQFLEAKSLFQLCFNSDQTTHICPTWYMNTRRFWVGIRIHWRWVGELVWSGCCQHGDEKSVGVSNNRGGSNKTDESEEQSLRPDQERDRCADKKAGSFPHRHFCGQISKCCNFWRGSGPESGREEQTEAGQTEGSGGRCGRRRLSHFPHAGPFWDAVWKYGG